VIALQRDDLKCGFFAKLHNAFQTVPSLRAAINVVTEENQTIARAQFRQDLLQKITLFNGQLSAHS